MSAPTGPGAGAGPGSAGGGAPAPPALAVRGLSAAYGPYRALFDISLTVPAGAAVALLGPNGAGKSTVARVVTGLLPATAGSVVVDGRDVTNRAAYRIARAGVAHLVEGRGVFSELTVEENLTLAIRRKVGRRERPDCVRRAYDLFPALGRRRRLRAGALSGGQQRLLSLAKVLVVPTRLVVADELSLGLAPVAVDAVYEALARARQAGTALLVVEQQVDRVLGLAEEAVVLGHGTVVFAGPAGRALAAVEEATHARRPT